jgi:DNA-binding MarR family transcriptional regulator
MSTREALIGEIGREASAWQTAVQRFDELAAERMNLHVTDVQILGFLANEEPLATGQLAEAAGLSPGAATTAVDRLENAGYVQRVRSDEDRRRVLVQLTPKARKINEQIWGPLVAEGLAKLYTYSAKEIALLHEFVHWCNALQLRHIERLRNSREGR